MVDINDMHNTFQCTILYSNVNDMMFVGTLQKNTLINSTFFWLRSVLSTLPVTTTNVI